MKRSHNWRRTRRLFASSPALLIARAHQTSEIQKARATEDSWTRAPRETQEALWSTRRSEGVVMALLPCATSLLQPSLRSLPYAIFLMQRGLCNLPCAISLAQPSLRGLRYATFLEQTFVKQPSFCNLCYAPWLVQLPLYNPACATSLVQPPLCNLRHATFLCGTSLLQTSSCDSRNLPYASLCNLPCATSLLQPSLCDLPRATFLMQTSLCDLPSAAFLMRPGLCNLSRATLFARLFHNCGQSSPSSPSWIVRAIDNANAPWM